MPASAAAADEAGRQPKASAACDSPGSHSAQAASTAAGTDAGCKSDSRAEGPQPGSTPRESGAHASASSAGDAPRVGVNYIGSGCSLKGLLSAGVSTGPLDADSRRAFAAFKVARARSTAHGAPSDRVVWDATDGSGGDVQSSSAESPPPTPCSATAAGTAAAVDGAGQLPTREAGRQPAETGSTQGEASRPLLSSAHAARVGKHQAAHDGQDQNVNHIRRCGPPRSAAVTGDSLECGKRRESSEGAGAASGGSVGKSLAASSEPLTPQQHAVVAALMVVMKRAMLEGREAFSTARERLWRNNPLTLVVLRFINSERELINMKDLEHVMRRDDQDLLDELAMQCTAAGFQPLQVFTRSAQCGAKAACTAALDASKAALPARHQQVAELDRVFAKHGFDVPWIRTNVNLLVRRGVLESMAELIMLVLLLMVELCKRSFRPSDTGQVLPAGYAALDHFLPGSCHFHTTMHRHVAIVASITSAIAHQSCTGKVADKCGWYLHSMLATAFVPGKVPCAGVPLSDVLLP